MSKRLNPPGVLPVTEIIKKRRICPSESVCSAWLKHFMFEITLFTAFLRSFKLFWPFRACSFLSCMGKIVIVTSSLRIKRTILFGRARKQLSYVGDEAVKSRERAAILSACRSLVCLWTHTKPQATCYVISCVPCQQPMRMRDVGVYVNQKVR